MSDSHPSAAAENPSDPGGVPQAVVRALARLGLGEDLQPEPLAGDVGQRRYFRLRAARAQGGEPPPLVVLYPPSLVPAWRRFRVTGDLLAAVGVRVPRVVDAGEIADGDGPGGAWMLVEDLGPRTLWQTHRPAAGSPSHGSGAPTVSPGSPPAVDFRRAVTLLERIQSLPVAAARALSPPLDEELLTREMEGTWQAFLEPRGLRRGSAPGTLLDGLLTDLCARLGAEPPVVCHRDFMVRNLVPMAKAGEPGGASLAVLDHQDLRPGPHLYDLASLLNDSLFPDAELEAELVTTRAATTGSSEDELRDSYHRTAAQRALKAVGTYARSGHHGELIAPTLARALDHLERTPEGERQTKRLPELRRRLSGLLD